MLQLIFSWKTDYNCCNWFWQVNFLVEKLVAQTNCTSFLFSWKTDCNCCNWFLYSEMLHSNVITWSTVALWYVRTRGQMLHSNVSPPISRIDVTSIVYSPAMDDPCPQVPDQFQSLGRYKWSQNPKLRVITGNVSGNDQITIL